MLVEVASHEVYGGFAIYQNCHKELREFYGGPLGYSRLLELSKVAIHQFLTVPSIMMTSRGASRLRVLLHASPDNLYVMMRAVDAKYKHPLSVEVPE